MLRGCGVTATQLYHPHAYIGLRPERRKIDSVYNTIEGMLGRTAYTIVVSSGEETFAKDQLKIPGRRIYRVRHGVDLGVFSPAPLDVKRRLRESLGLPAGMTILGSMGRASAQKDPATLYQAFAKAAAQRPIALFHVGRGELDSELEQWIDRLGIRSRVFRRPYMSTPAEFYRAVDGFALTSLYEGFSLAALEALAADLPLILSEVPGNLDLLAEPLSHAWAVPPKDVDGFAQAIGAWHDTTLKPLPVNHRQIARWRYDSRSRLAAVLDLYRVLASGNGRS
jgi:glycosyltransferase involved in cell wall biosynthesis